MYIAELDAARFEIDQRHREAASARLARIARRKPPAREQ
jgi:hypothetical protein